MVPDNTAASKLTASRTNPVLGIVGNRRAGKTTFLAVLRQALLNAGCEDVTVTGGDESEKYVQQLEGYVTSGVFPPATKETGDPDKIVFDVKEGGKKFTLNCFDPAGELFDHQGVASDIERQALDQIKNCTGLIVLLDPDLLSTDGRSVQEDGWSNAWQKVERYLNKDYTHVGYDGKTYKGPRVAFCISKADENLFQRRFRTKDASDWVSKKDSGSRIMNATGPDRLNMETRWFFVSSLGWLDGAPNIHTYVDSFRINTKLADLEDVNLLQVPDPAADRMSAENDHERFMKNFPAFTDPLRFAQGRFNRQSSDSKVAVKEEQKEEKLKGVHVGFGRETSLRNIKAGRSRIRPWNVAESVLWLVR